MGGTMARLLAALRDARLAARDYLGLLEGSCEIRRCPSDAAERVRRPDGSVADVCRRCRDDLIHEFGWTHIRHSDEL